MSVRTDHQVSHLGVASILIAVVVWATGLMFTRQLVPFNGVTDILAWGLAFVLQAALTVAQINQRAIGWRDLKWPYVALILVDVSLNSLGLLISTHTVQTAVDALLYVLRAITTGAGAWQTLGALLVGALIAALPEQLIRDAL